MTLKGKTALVTGAARGIGRAIAARLARDGATVIVNYSRSEADAASLVAEIETAGGTAFAVAADVGDTNAIERMFADLRARGTALDILVNNAGRGSGGLPTLDQTTLADYDLLFELNARGLFFTTQAAARIMNDGGRIISVSSGAAKTRTPGLSAYSGSKAAVEAFTRIWSVELAPRRITVNSVSPGIVETDLIRNNMTEELAATFAAQVPLGRMGQPDDLADVVAFLAGHDARWITGQDIAVNGGA